MLTVPETRQRSSRPPAAPTTFPTPPNAPLPRVTIPQPHQQSVDPFGHHVEELDIEDSNDNLRALHIGLLAHRKSSTFASSVLSVSTSEAGVNTDEAGAPDCIALVQKSFLDNIWAPSRQVLVDCRERDLFGILKPLELHIRVEVMERYFLPMRLLITDEEEMRRSHLTDLEDERRQLLQSLEQHLRLVSLPTYASLNKGATELEAVRAEIRAMCKLR
eukprot:GILI01034916.1.p1 GENE.GILI01034916.1~~GILI01034916.1.p1  ORF type:complete len:230 (+),score=33.07 GILI01034916.1:39-692(+)